MIWASPSHIALAIWVRVRVTGDAHIATILGMRMPKTLGCPYHCHTEREINKSVPTEESKIHKLFHADVSKRNLPFFREDCCVMFFYEAKSAQET